MSGWDGLRSNKAQLSAVSNNASPRASRHIFTPEYNNAYSAMQ